MLSEEILHTLLEEVLQDGHRSHRAAKVVSFSANCLKQRGRIRVHKVLNGEDAELDLN